MRSFLLIFCLFIVGLLHAQSKKEQIEILTKRVDSLNEVVGSERKINLDKSNKISELTNTIANLESSISSLNADVSRLTSELQQSKTESATKTQDLAKLQTQLKTKTDSLTLVLNELEKLKPAPKPLVTNDKNSNSSNQITQTGSLKSVKIGTQIWMTENLNVSTFRNGDPISEAKTNEEWGKAEKEGKPAWCYYNNDPKNGSKYGKLYNWYAVNDPRGLAPTGWHVPTDEEWKKLENYLGEDAGNKMKSSSGWNGYGCKRCEGGSEQYKILCSACKGKQKNSSVSYSGNGTNSSGFSAFPGGSCYFDGDFSWIGESGSWWSASEYETNRANYFFLNHDSSGAGRYWDYKWKGFSVRCLRD